MIRPVREGTRISQLWGANPSYCQRAFGIPYHNGVDYAAPVRTPILAVAQGTVIWRDYDHQGYGKQAPYRRCGLLRIFALHGGQTRNDVARTWQNGSPNVSHVCIFRERHQCPRWPSPPVHCRIQ